MREYYARSRGRVAACRTCGTVAALSAGRTICKPCRNKQTRTWDRAHRRKWNLPQCSRCWLKHESAAEGLCALCVLEVAA